MTLPTMIPFAIDVTDQVPVSGKPWSGGIGNPKLVLHTIEAADPWDIGWPRIWSRWSSAPHLAMNSHEYPYGDWLYQTLPFDVAAYAIRDNDLEDNRFMYQMEMAGRAANVPNYPDTFYEAIATVADWFVEEMGVPDTWLDFSCASASKTSPCRHSRGQMDLYAGFAGHCHVGYGLDSHWDPGKLDTARVQSFMTDTEESNMPPLDIFLAYIRISDIQKMGRDEIITPGEVIYFTTEPMWTEGNPQGNTDVNASDWENLYNAYRTRAPIWAV